MKTLRVYYRKRELPLQNTMFEYNPEKFQLSFYTTYFSQKLKFDYSFLQ